jgi:hypothetical protein
MQGCAWEAHRRMQRTLVAMQNSETQMDIVTFMQFTCSTVLEKIRGSCPIDRQVLLLI